MTMFPAGRTIVITGGGRGIGEEAVKKFLMKGAKVRRYIGVQSEETCAAVQVIAGVRSPDSVQRKFDELISGDKALYPGTVTCLYLDLMR